MKAITKNLRISPRKLNVIAGIVRGMPVESALAQLQYTPKKAARILYKTIASAAANAENTRNAKRRNLVITKIVVQKGTILRRGVPVSRGRWHRIQKIMSHVYVELTDISPVDKKAVTKEKKAETKAAPVTSAPDMKPVAKKIPRLTLRKKKEKAAAAA